MVIVQQQDGICGNSFGKQRVYLLRKLLRDDGCEVRWLKDDDDQRKVPWARRGVAAFQSIAVEP